MTSPAPSASSRASSLVRAALGTPTPTPACPAACPAARPSTPGGYTTCPYDLDSLATPTQRPIYRTFGLGGTPTVTDGSSRLPTVVNHGTPTVLDGASPTIVKSPSEDGHSRHTRLIDPISMPLMPTQISIHQDVQGGDVDVFGPVRRIRSHPQRCADADLAAHVRRIRTALWVKHIRAYAAFTQEDHGRTEWADV
ncbi:hypothetical protein MSAN_01578100 [Mycena sanguinolenta]|uniref:Uncharacterized protein n=1 Tax=Mycena sanguinolenta TaxID=230812 RepID=A0A8H7CV65_9AGAR|nr:hypothetical protein MSAN_01578100 [Mycena sanguinolenta]